MPDATRTTVILVVDDDPLLRAYVCQCLDQLPVVTEQARNGREALERIRNGDNTAVSLVLADVHMDSIDGRMLKDVLRDDPMWSGLPVVLITGDILEAQDKPALRKPFNARQVCAVVQNILDLGATPARRG